MKKEVIHGEHAPKAIGPYSQAIRAGGLIYLSGQIPLKPETMEMLTGEIEEEASLVFSNMKAVLEAAGTDLQSIIKLTIYLTDLSLFNQVNQVMMQFFEPPYPARVTLAVSALPRQARIEIEAIALSA